MKSHIWSEDKLQLSKKEYIVAHRNSISLAEKQRLIALEVWLLPEEWVTIRT